MNTYYPVVPAQNSTKTALFNVFSHRQQIAKGISGALAMRFKRCPPACIIKFQGFEVAL